MARLTPPTHPPPSTGYATCSRRASGARRHSRPVAQPSLGSPLSPHTPKHSQPGTQAARTRRLGSTTHVPASGAGAKISRPQIILTAGLPTGPFIKRLS
ncbi:unnamed protein product [Protopolystoma xenopodis]|uniref:Uncharacterized protein n=1 Tax=Protopolystoma xenopodis TaxID=117903 RepID=A0A448XMJ1_9PLAT|nr:unnamed protein product [Protopolystoma xenopodis]